MQQSRCLCERSRLGCLAVLVLTALLILLMPFTEHFCRWDTFPRGGPDLEFFVLCLLLLAGLVLVMAHRSTASPFFRLLAHRLIIVPYGSRAFFARGPFSLLSSKRDFSQGADSTFLSFPGIPLRI
jgi:hypothetical protein